MTRSGFFSALLALIAGGYGALFRKDGTSADYAGPASNPASIVLPGDVFTIAADDRNYVVTAVYHHNASQHPWPPRP